MYMTLTCPCFPGHPVSVQAPPSKSIAHRLLLLSALNQNPVQILLSERNADIDATIRCLQTLGTSAEANAAGLFLTPKPWKPSDRELTLNVGESGSTLRFLLPLLGVHGISAVIRMEGRLPERPLAPLDRVLMSHGMKLAADASDKSLLHVSGTLRPGLYEIDGSVSSQFLTGLLLSLPQLESRSTLHVIGKISSAPYIRLTLQALRTFHAEPAFDSRTRTFSIDPMPLTADPVLSVEGDYSGAAFFLCAGAVLPHGITAYGLLPDSTQGDRQILEILKTAGCRVRLSGNSVTVCPPQQSRLHAFSADMDSCPDLVPPLAVLACAAEGTSVLSGCARLRTKESDRLAALTATLNTLGGRVRTDGHVLTVTGTGRLRGGCVCGRNDHRMVMSACLAALLADQPVTVSDAQSVNKSYPRFFEDCKACGFLVRESSAAPVF